MTKIDKYNTTIKLLGIYTPYFNGWYEIDIMRNGGTNNIAVSAVSGVGSFSETWLTSNGT